MIRIKLAELFKHRNETTFRPYLLAKDLFEDIGVRFVTEGDCDLTWVGQASYNDKKSTYTYGNCISRGLHFLNTEVRGDYVLFDGQDSASLLGSFDVFKNSEAKLLLKNSLYRTFEDYLTPWKMGRMYWGTGEPLLYPNGRPDETFGHTLLEADRERFGKVKLTGCNWLSTVKPVWYDYKKLNKDIDVFALFSYPAKDNIEYGCLTSVDYDAHRKPCIDELIKLRNSGLKIAMLEGGKHVPIQEYYNLMSRSKIVVAPFGYGEIAPRDIEAAQFGAILYKPSMFHLQTIPNIYTPDTYVPLNWDYSNMNDCIYDTLASYSKMQEPFVESMRSMCAKNYKPENLVTHTYEWLTKLEGFYTE